MGVGNAHGIYCPKLSKTSWGSLTPSLSIFPYRLSVTTSITRGLPRYARNDKGAGTLFLLGLQGATPLRKLGQLDPKTFYLSVSLECYEYGIRVKGIIPLWVWATPTNSIAQVKQNEVLRYSRR